MKTSLARLLALLIIAAMILGACQQTTPTTAPQQTQAPQATQAPAATQATDTTQSPTEVAEEDPYAGVDPSGETVMFWHNHTGSRETALNEIIREFNETNEWGITVLAEYQGSYNDIYNKMLTFMNTEDVPNVVVAYQNNAASYQLADSLVDMNYLVDSPTWGLSDEDKADFFPGFFYQDIFPIFGNQRLGFPPNRSMEVVYINTEWLAELGYDAPPATPQEFKEVACAAAANPFSKSQAADSYGFSFTNDASNFASLVFAMGGNIYNPATNTYTYNTEAARGYMQIMQEMFDEGCAVMVTERYGEQTDFATARSLMTMGSSSGIMFYADAVNSAAQFEWTTAAIPHTTANPVMNIYGASVSIPRATLEKELAAWLFIKYYTLPDVNARWATVSTYFPVRASSAESLTDYFAENPAYEDAFNLLPYGISEPPVPGYDPVRILVAEAAAAIVQGANIDETLANLDVEANAILQEQMALVPESPDPLKDVDPTGETVTFWHNHSGGREQALNEMIATFNDTNEYGITVEATYQGSYNDIYNKMVAVIGTADVPDLVVAYQNNAATYQLSDGLIDMNILVNSYRWGLSPAEKADFFKAFFNQDVFPIFGNQRLGFPPNRSMEVVYVNMDWLAELGYDAPPTTPEEFKEMACAASATPFSGSTAADNYGLSFTNDASNFASWTFAFGGDIFDARNSTYTYNSDAAVAAATFIQGLFDDGCAVIVTERYGEQTDFATGRSLFTMGSSSGFYFYADAVSGASDFEWTAAAVPHTTDNPVQNVYGASVSMPAGTSRERQVATWLFLKWFTSPEINAEWATISGYYPVRASSAAALDDYFAENPAFQTTFSLLPYGKFEPPVPGYDPVRILVTEAVAAIVTGANIQSTLDMLTEEANAILAEQMAQVP